MKPYKTIRKRGEYFNDIGMIIEVLNAQTYKTMDVAEVETLIDAAKVLKKKIKLGKKYYQRRKRKGMTDRGRAHIELVKRARKAGNTYQEQLKIERELS